MFLLNLHLTDGILQTELKRHGIALLVEEFKEILNLSHEDTIVEPRDKVGKYNSLLDISTLKLA